jgi:hypothetical protein
MALTMLLPCLTRSPNDIGFCTLEIVVDSAIFETSTDELYMTPSILTRLLTNSLLHEYFQADQKHL